MNARLIEAAVVSIAALSMTVHLVRLRALARASMAWPKVLGRVTQADVVNAISWGGSDNDEFYRVLLRYAYRVADRHYVGTRISFRSRNLSQKSAAATAARLPRGAEVEVYYDPASPADAVLEPGALALDDLWLTALLLYAGSIWLLLPG